MKKQKYDELITRIKNAKTHDELDEIERDYIKLTEDHYFHRSLVNKYINQRRNEL